MTRELLAKALAKGVEAAAKLEYADAKRMLDTNDAMVGDVLADKATAGGDFARWRVDAIQELADEKGPSVEVSVNSSDGKHEIGVYFYVRRDLAQSS